MLVSEPVVAQRGFIRSNSLVGPASCGLLTSLGLFQPWFVATGSETVVVELYHQIRVASVI